MTQPTPIPTLEARRDQILGQLATIGDLSSGSLGSRRLRCGNPRCRCKQPGEVGHGPYWYLTRKIGGKSVACSIAPSLLESVRRQMAEHKRFRALTGELVEVSDQLSRARLAQGDLAKGNSDKRETLSRQFSSDIRVEIEALVGDGEADGLDFEALETAVRRRMLELGARGVERRVNGDRSDHSSRHLPCSCGREARYAGRHSKTFETVLGELTLERAYYHCADCGQGFFPRDRALGLDNTSLSPATTRMVGSAAALASFAEASSLLAELAGVRVEAKQVERVAEGLGRAIADDERGVVEREQPGASTMYLGMDGTGVPVRRQETEGRQGKQSDGSAKTREGKLVLVWTAESRNREGQPMRDPGSVSYSGAIESAASRDTDPEPAAFARRVWREAERRGFGFARRRVILGDGAAWIWNLANEQFPGATQVVDLFHAKQHLSQVSKALHGTDPQRAQVWTQARWDELEGGRLADLTAALREHAGICEEARQCADYVERNRERMRYAQFRARGLCVTSGVVEAGCKVAVGLRLKQAGMHWSVGGANSILALRCCKLSGRYEDFWERRSSLGRNRE